MKTNNVNGQNGAATSAMENIFSKKSVLDFAVYAFNKMTKNPNGCSGKFSVVVGDNWRITMDSYMEENECRLVLNIYLEKKFGSRYCRMQKINTGLMDMATEYMSNGSWKSVVVYEIKSKIEKMVDMLLDSYIKDNSDWSIKKWEKLTGMVYNAPIAEVEDDEDELDAEDFLRENMPIIPVDIIKETITEVLDDEETFYRVFGGINRCDFNDFADIVWEKTWEKVLDANMSDEALESETREWMEFEDRVRFMLESDASDKYEFVVNYHNELCCSEREENNDAPNLNKDVLVTYLMNLDSRPNWVNRDVFDFEVDDVRGYLDIIMFGGYHIGLHFDPNDSISDFANVEGSSAYAKEDLLYAAEIMDNRDEILALAGYENVDDGYDIDRGIERVADTIEKYLGSYTPSYLDKFGDCCICVGWDNFNEDDMRMLIEDNIFAISVRDTLYDRGVIVNLSGFLVYDDGVYVTVDYDKMFNN